MNFLILIICSALHYNDFICFDKSSHFIGMGGKKSTLMKLRKKLSGKELRVDATVANIREEENTNPKIPINIPVCMMLENDPAERKPKKGSR